MRWISLICLCAIVSSGCATLDDYHYLVVHHHRSGHAWKKYRPGVGHRGDSAHYASGWKQGYFEVSTGGSGEPPAVPPQKYWSPKYQGPVGQTAIEDWYAGFQDGATVAESEGNGAWHAIYSGPTVPIDPPFWDFPELVPAEPHSASVWDQAPHLAPPPVPQEPDSLTELVPPPVVASPVDRGESERPVPPQLARETDEPAGLPARAVPPLTSRRTSPTPREPARTNQPTAEQKPALESAPVAVAVQPISTRIASVPRRTESGATAPIAPAQEKPAPKTHQVSSRRIHRTERVVIPEVFTEE